MLLRRTEGPVIVRTRRGVPLEDVMAVIAVAIEGSGLKFHEHDTTSGTASGTSRRTRNGAPSELAVHIHLGPGQIAIMAAGPKGTNEATRVRARRRLARLLRRRLREAELA